MLIQLFVLRPGGLREGPRMAQGGLPGASRGPGARVKKTKNQYFLQGPTQRPRRGPSHARETRENSSSGPPPDRCIRVYSVTGLSIAQSIWVRRGPSNSRTRLRGSIFGPILASAVPGVTQNLCSRRHRRWRGRREPGFCPTPGGTEAKIGPKMGPRSRVRLLLRPRRTQQSIILGFCVFVCIGLS